MGPSASHRIQGSPLTRRRLGRAPCRGTDTAGHGPAPTGRGPFGGARSAGTPRIPALSAAALAWGRPRLKLGDTMAARKKKQPWSAGKDLFPELMRGVPHPSPRPLEPKPLVGHSTASHMPARWRIERIAADGTRDFVRVGPHPWEGSERKARIESFRLEQEEPGVRFEVVECYRK